MPPRLHPTRGWIRRLTTRPPPPQPRSPSSPAAHPSNAIDRPSPPAGVFLPKDRPTSHRLHRASPASESHRGRAQRERGVMTPGARSPTTGRRVEPGGGVRKQYFQGWRRKVGGRGGRRQHPSPANASMIVASRAEGFGTPRPTMAEPYRTRQSTHMRAAEGFGCHFQGWHQQQQQQQQQQQKQQHNSIGGGFNWTYNNWALRAQYRVQGCDDPPVQRTDHVKVGHTILGARGRTCNTTAKY